MAASYRENSAREQPQEARVADLLPATRERLQRACEHGEALGSERPRWVGRPAAWALTAGAVAVALLAPLVGSFGRIDERPFASRPYEQVLLALAIGQALVLGAFAVRSFALRRGGLLPGVFLFASGLVEIRDGRVRVWPLSRLRAIEQRESATLDLGDAGRVRLSTDEEDLATALASSRTRLSEAEHAQDTTTIAQLDPLHFEQSRGEVWRALSTSARLSAAGAPSPRARLAAAVGVLVAMGLGVVAMNGLRRASDTLGIRRATQRYDWRALASYVWAAGPLDEQSDQAWFDMAMREERDQGLLGYMSAPGLPRLEDDSRVQRIHRFAEADAVLAKRLLEQTSRGQWRETAISRLVPSDMVESESASGDRGLPLKVAIERIEQYLAVWLPGQTFRPLLERRLLKLRVIQSDSRLVCPSPSQPGDPRMPPAQDDDPLAIYLTQGDGPEGDARNQPEQDDDPHRAHHERSSSLGPEAAYIRRKQRLSLASRCHNLGDLEKSRPKLTDREAQSDLYPTWRSLMDFEQAWKSFFEELRAATARSREVTHDGETPPPVLFEMLDALWAYLAAHPETNVWGRPLLDDHAATPTAQEGWGAMLRPHADKLSIGQIAIVMRKLGHALPSDILEWRVLTGGPRLEFYRHVEEHDETLELTLFLPNIAPRTARIHVR